MRTAVLVATLAATVFGANAQVSDTSPQGGVEVIINGQTVEFRDGGPTMVRGRILVPLRDVLRTLPASAIVWDTARQTVSAAYMDRTAKLTIGSRNATVNGRIIDLDVPATTIDGRTMVPLRFLSEALGAVVTHNELGRKVVISMPMAPVPQGAVVNRPPTVTVRRSQPRRFFRTDAQQAFAPQQVMTDEELLVALERQVQADFEQWMADRAAWAADRNSFIVWASLQQSFNSMMFYNGSFGINGLPQTQLVPLDPSGWMQWQWVLEMHAQRDSLNRQRLDADYAAYVQVFRRVNPGQTPWPKPVP